ncbi:guanine deaminase [Multifurca ochricompacta]|uniref:Guanine deaminase n=1 Tax=Multifurca ochricompacta TaxID=376703 RepID=A0AAD4MA55_9AGAM|nr:guanine deaminase [Multifurca ochricompacta]
MALSQPEIIFYGPLINPKSVSSFQALPKCLLAVGASGNIDWIEEHVHESALQDVLAHRGSLNVSFIRLKHGEFILPGFVDTHTHAPQAPNTGSGQQYELLDWLKEKTFPMEARFVDVDFARRAYDLIVKRIIDSGTTTCCYYGTLHLEATKILADVISKWGQRAFVGKCNMNRNSQDDYVEATVSGSINATHALISHIRALPPPRLVEPVLTPRFAISCSGPLLSALGDMARADPSLRIQTHISENRNEIHTTLKFFPEATSYADVYDRHGLLGPRTILAHAVHLEEDEIALVKERNAGVSHCPTSNFNLRSGICPVGKFIDRGIKVGLGTDVSGATSTYADKQLPLSALLHLATVGGAQVCGFDALLVSVRSDTGNPGLWSADLDQELQVGVAGGKVLEAWLERFFFTGDDRNIRRVYVQGRWIGGAEGEL